MTAEFVKLALSQISDNALAWHVVTMIGRASDRQQAQAAYRIGVKRLHPDVGGDVADFMKVQLAWERYNAKCAVQVDTGSSKAQRYDSVAPDATWGQGRTR